MVFLENFENLVGLSNFYNLQMIPFVEKKNSRIFTVIIGNKTGWLLKYHLSA